MDEGKNSVKKGAQLIALGFELAAPVIVGVIGGYYLDRKLGSQPLCILLGTVGGFLYGLRTLFRVLKRLN